MTVTGVFMFRGILNASKQEILKSKNPCNESLNKLPKYYYFEILVLKHLKTPEHKHSWHTPKNIFLQFMNSETIRSLSYKISKFMHLHMLLDEFTAQG